MWKSLEALASACGLISVVLSIYKYVWVYPVGMASTIAYIFIMLKARLYGDSLVNVIYTVVSAYGWYQWSQLAEDGQVSVRRATQREKIIGFTSFVAGVALIWVIYWVAGQQSNWLDMMSSSMFAVAMWLMAEQCLESWVLWFIGDAMSVAKVVHNGLYFTGVQYVILTAMAVWGWYEWWVDIKKAENEQSDDAPLSA